MPWHLSDACLLSAGLEVCCCPRTAPLETSRTRLLLAFAREEHGRELPSRPLAVRNAAQASGKV